MKLGKTAARPGAVKLELRKYISLSQLPTPPSDFGEESLIGDFGMLGNADWGDCVWAGAAHETMLWNKEAGRDAPFDDGCVLSDYSAATGFNPADPSTDQGTDMQQAAAYRQKTGIVDAQGNRHKVGAYLAIAPGSIYEHMIAAYVFGSVGVGIEFPGSAMDQFSNEQPWSVVHGATIEGGHYIPIIGRSNLRFQVVTWAKVQAMDDDFLYKYRDESIVYLSEEFMSGDKSINGFDLDQLKHDLSQLRVQT
jgi:hypothetical protein